MRRKRYLAILCLLAVIASVGGGLLDRTRFFRLIHLKAGDLQFLLRGRRQPSNIVILAIDQKSLDNFREPMIFWHPYYAEAIRASAVAGAKVFGLDVSFEIPVTKWDKTADLVLAQAVQDVSARMPVVCTYVPTLIAHQQDDPVMVNMIAAHNRLVAYVNLLPDEDDFVRRLEIIEKPGAPGADPPLRSLALRSAEKYAGADAQMTGDGMTLAGRQIPLSGPRIMTINYAGPAGTFPTISLYDFLTAVHNKQEQRIQQWVGGKIVLLGREDTVDDRHPTPYYTLASLGSGSLRQANTYGVEIHASALDTMLEGIYLVAVPNWVRWLALIAAGLVASSVAGLLGRWSGPALLAMATATVALTQMLFRVGRVLSASEILLSAAMALVVTLVYRSMFAEKRGATYSHAITQFVGKRVANMLEENDKLPATGSRHTVTILFSDIRGFTAFCDDKDPAVVVELLNEYLRGMVSIIVRHHGHANKFIGDGIMAIFSDEDGSTPGDHASRAAQCGLEMVQARGEFRTGVGLHTGVALIGIVGSADKMEFTALGDTVNLASRLEGLNKEYRTQLLMSDATRARLDASIETVCLGEVQVRGRNAPMRLYTLAALHPVASDTAASVERR